MANANGNPAAINNAGNPALNIAQVPDPPRQQYVSKIPVPRTLSKIETLDSLNQWKTQIKNFYRRDDQFKTFLSADATWNPLARYKGQAQETSGLRRSPAEMSDDLEVFLHLIAGYIPFSFIREKFDNDTRNMADVWNLVFEVFGHEINQDSFLDFVDLPRDTGETHRQFFERLYSHVVRHLTPANVTAGGMASGTGDKFNISMANMVVGHWMRLIDPRLVKMVRVEYATELRQGAQLISLMPRIARAADTLIARAETSSINNIKEEEDDGQVDAHLNQLGFDKGNFNNKKKKKNFGHLVANFGQKPTPTNRGNHPDSPYNCHHCEQLNKRLKSSFNVFHNPDTCFRARHNIRLVHAEEAEGPSVTTTSEDDTGQSKGPPFPSPDLSNPPSFQNKVPASRPGSQSSPILSDCMIASILSPDSTGRHAQSTLLAEKVSNTIRSIKA